MHTHQSTVAKQGTEFYIHWENASIHTIQKDGTNSISKGDFSIKLTTLVEAGSNRGYVAVVKRRIDKHVLVAIMCAAACNSFTHECNSMVCF